MKNRLIERYRKRTILFHWVHAAAFVILLITGATKFLPGIGPSGGYSTGIVHRIAAVVFIALPLLYFFYEPRKAIGFIKETLIWGKDDLKWLIAAPNYYFGGSEEKMPPQDRFNTGQKMWQLVIVVTGCVFLVTGAIMWLFRSKIAIDVYEWVLFVHGIAFIVVFVMFLVHIYMSVLHPRMRGSFSSMLDGKISSSYAKRHHPKWYDRVSSLWMHSSRSVLQRPHPKHPL
jgi:formate dehydrogenase subunit gamma